MQNGGVIPWDAMPIAPLHGCTAGCLCCMGVKRLPTEEELEQRISDMIDSEGLETAIRDEIDNKQKAVINGVHLSGL